MSGLDGQEQTYEALYQDDAKMDLILPEIIWRLNKLIVPLNNLQFEISFQRFKGQIRTPHEIPCIEEFLRFVAPDKAGTLSEDWPWLDS